MIFEIHFFGALLSVPVRTVWACPTRRNQAELPHPDGIVGSWPVEWRQIRSEHHICVWRLASPSCPRSRINVVDYNDLSRMNFGAKEEGFRDPDPRFVYLDWPLAWSYDGEAYDFADLPMHLWRASSLMMGEAIKRALGEDSSGGHIAMGNLIAAISCGTAVELMAKAFLAHVNPGLITTDASSMLILNGDIEYLPSNPRLKTRMGGEVLTTARNMIEAKTSSAPWTIQDQERVLEARNSVAHLGLLRKDGADFMAAGHTIIGALLLHAEDYGVNYWTHGAQLG